jgi:hypothetical protein
VNPLCSRNAQSQKNVKGAARQSFSPSRTRTIRMCLFDGHRGTITGTISGKVKPASLEGSLGR